MSSIVDKLPLFGGQTEKNPPRISPDNGRVFRIARDYLAKTPRSPDYVRELSDRNLIRELENLERIYGVWSKAYEKGINVPQPLGIYRTTFDFRKSFGLFGEKVSSPAIVYRFVPGITLEEAASKYNDGNAIHEDNFGLAFGSWLREIQKAREAGFRVLDHAMHNAVWNPEERQTYLIDLDSWEYPGGRN